MSPNLKKIFIFLGVLLLTVATAKATEYTSPSFKIKDPVIAPGGGLGTSTNFRLNDTQGQIGISKSSSTNFGLLGGYQYYPSTASTLNVTAILINNGSPITLTQGTTTPVSVGFTITDNSGCSSVFAGGGVTTTVFRSGIGPNCTPDDQNCYVTNSQINNCVSGNSATATATIPIWYFAEPTDASSTFSGQTWQAQVTASNLGNSSSTATSTGVNLNTLLAFELSTGTLNYGSVGAGQNTGATNKIINIQNTGNSSSTIKISGTSLNYNTNIIATSSQHYATNTFTYNVGDTPLTGVLTTIAGLFLNKPTSTAAVQKNIYWGISAEAGNPIGNYSGTNTIVAVWSN